MRELDVVLVRQHTMFHLRRVTTERSVAGYWWEVREVEQTACLGSTSSTTTGSRHHGSLLGQILLLDLRGEVGWGCGGVVFRGLGLGLGNTGGNVVAEGRRGGDVGAGPSTSDVRILERLLRSKTGGSRETWRTIIINNSESHPYLVRIFSIIRD